MPFLQEELTVSAEIYGERVKKTKQNKHQKPTVGDSCRSTGKRRQRSRSDWKKHCCSPSLGGFLTESKLSFPKVVSFPQAIWWFETTVLVLHLMKQLFLLIYCLEKLDTWYLTNCTQKYHHMLIYKDKYYKYCPRLTLTYVKKKKKKPRCHIFIKSSLNIIGLIFCLLRKQSL